jgi:tetratricopeptide (TPR) repeat protein
LLGLATVEWSAGDIEKMLATAERTLELALGEARADLFLELGAAVHYVGAGMYLGGTPATMAVSRMREIVEACGDDRVHAADARMALAHLLASLDRSDEGRRELATAQTLVDDLRSPWMRLFAQAATGRFELLAGDHVAAEAHLKAATEGWRNLGIPSNAAYSGPSWAEALDRLGRPEEAIAVIDEFAPLAGPWDVQPRIEFGTAHARAFAALDRVDDAATMVEDALTLVRPTGFVALLADVLSAKAEVYARGEMRPSPQVVTRSLSTNARSSSCITSACVPCCRV